MPPATSKANGNQNEDKNKSLSISPTLGYGVLLGMRLSGYVYVPVLVYETMVAWKHQNLEQEGDVGLLNSGSGFWLTFINPK